MDRLSRTTQEFCGLWRNCNALWVVPTLSFLKDPRSPLVVGGRNNMGPKHTPSDWTFWLSLALVLLAILSVFAKIPYISTHPLWIAVIGYAILVIGCTVKTT